MEEDTKKKADNVGETLAISGRELSQILGISLRQCWRLNAAGRLPRPIRLGGSVRWNHAEIRQWFETGCPDRTTWDAMKEASR